MAMIMDARVSRMAVMPMKCDLESDWRRYLSPEKIPKGGRKIDLR